MELTNIQRQIITTNESHVLVMSAAASGKSAVIVERLRYLLKQGIDPSKIVAITFTNNAASVMYERLGHPDGLFIGTVHSYCNYLLRGNAIDTTKIIQEERFDDLFQEIKENISCLKHIEHLLVDEVQDSTTPQFEFFELLKPDNYMYCGDVRQSIYGFNGANPDYINQLSKREDVTVYYMRNNFRNAPNILRFAKRFLFKLGDDYFDDSIAMRMPESKKPQVIEKTCTLEEAVELLMSYNESLETNWGDWFVLCRTNKDIENFRFLFKKKGIPTDTFKQADLTNSQIKKKMEENTIKILTVHSAKGLENKCVLSFNIRAYNDEETRLCYVSATRAKDFLFWVKMPKKKKRSRIVSWE